MDGHAFRRDGDPKSGISGGRWWLRGLFRRTYPVLHVFWVILDVFIAVVVLTVLTHLMLGEFTDKHRLLAVVIVALMFPVYNWSALYYGLRNRSVAAEIELLIANMFVVVSSLVLTGLLTDTLKLFEPKLIAGWAITTFCVLAVLHLGVRWIAHVARAHDLNIYRALLIGNGEPLKRIHRSLTVSPWRGVNVVGYVDTAEGASTNPGRRDADRRARASSSDHRDAEDLPERLGGIDDIPQLMRELDIDGVYLAVPGEQTHWLPAIVHDLLRLQVDINWSPDLSIFDLVSYTQTQEIDGSPVFCLTSSPLGTRQATFKWLEDVILASLISVVVSPLLIAIAIAVKLSSKGPVLFVQERYGLDGRIIRVWKFRTMYVNGGSGVERQATRDDPRVTDVGRFLRRWSLDELPQILQVVLGTMSLVGPRPHPLWLDDRYAKILRGYMQRHRVKPGITGWAQINGWRGETDYEEKMEKRLNHDLYYINHWSILLDLKILLLTPLSVIRGKNAY